MTDDDLTYVPNAGLTIKEALARAVLISRRNDKPIKAIINDVEMNITGETNLKEALDEYHKRLDESYKKLNQNQRD